VRYQILECAKDVLDKSGQLVEEARKAVNNQQNLDNNARLATSAKAVSQALNNCVNCLPGLRDVNTAAQRVASVSQRLSSGNVSAQVVVIVNLGNNK
jgi:talin